MRGWKLLLTLSILVSSPALGQDLPWYRRASGTGPPTGACAFFGQAYLRTDAAEIYTCLDNAWTKTYPSEATPSFPPSQVLSGCGVEYVTGLTFEAGACSYVIKGISYTSSLTNVTLGVADITNPRIDVIGVDVSGVVFTSPGTPDPNPSQPTIDQSTQLQLTFVFIPALSLIPSNVTALTIYDENIEWTSAVSANVNAASVNNPYRLTKDIEATTAVLGNYAMLTRGGGLTVDLAAYNTLVFYIRSKATWPTGGGGGSAARTLSIFWRDAGGVQRGQQVVLRSGVFGFDSSNTAVYQQISIPTSLFGANGLPVTTLRLQVSGNTGTSTLGWYIDVVTLQSGLGSGALPATLMNFRGTWNSTTAYVPNDVVVSAGTGYVALVAHTNVAVSTTATWAAVTPSAVKARGFGANFGKCGGSPLTAGEVAYLPEVPYACTITASSIVVDTGTATFKVWRIADGTAHPTVANSINTAGIALTVGTRLRSTTVTDFTSTAIAAHDVLAVNLFAVASATCVGVFVECDIH